MTPSEKTNIRVGSPGRVEKIINNGINAVAATGVALFTNYEIDSFVPAVKNASEALVHYNLGILATNEVMALSIAFAAASFAKVITQGALLGVESRRQKAATRN